MAPSSSLPSRPAGVAEVAWSRKPAARSELGSVADARWLPSTQSIVVGFALVLAATGAYVVARESSIFALQRVEVEGAPPAVAARIRSALAPMTGSSLVAFSSAAADRKLASIPEIARARYDRDFPHTLRVVVRSEEPVAVLRRAAEAWLVSGSGRVLSILRSRPYPSLPRVWLTASTDATPGVALADPLRADVRAASIVRETGFPQRVLSIQSADDRLVLDLPSGREVRLGDTSNLALKLAAAARVLPRAEGALYVDVSVPSRTVAGYSATPEVGQPGLQTSPNIQVSG